MQPQMKPVIQEEAVSQPEAIVADAAGWNSGLKIAFRFAFCYFVLYCFPFPVGALPYTQKLAEWYELPWHKVVPWVAQHWLRLAQPITTFSNGSGDTTYDYVKVLCFLVLATVAVIAWSVLDRKRKDYSKLHRWLRLYVRFTLGATLLSYGGYKLIPSQFPPNWQWRYLETYGDSSPMGILWTFMSSSRSYTIFTGAVEMLGGILLFVPRLATLGALVAIGAMTNVFVLNMSYDVPVKLYSFHLLLLAVFLLLPELKRLTRFFVLNLPTGPAFADLQLQRTWPNRSLLIGQLALGLFFAGAALYTSHTQLKNYTTGDLVVKPPLFGPWAVDEFTVDGQPRPPLLTDETRWQKAIFDFNTFFTVQSMDGKLLRFVSKMNTGNKSMELTRRTDAKWKGNLSYTLPTPQTMMMDGQLGEQKVHIKLHHLDSKYLLNTRGFHWINELPFNR